MIRKTVGLVVAAAAANPAGIVLGVADMAEGLWYPVCETYTI